MSAVHDLSGVGEVGAKRVMRDVSVVCVVDCGCARLVVVCSCLWLLVFLVVLVFVVVRVYALLCVLLSGGQWLSLVVCVCCWQLC